jgi:hypothetical protein
MVGDGYINRYYWSALNSGGKSPPTKTSIKTANNSQKLYLCAIGYLHSSKNSSHLDKNPFKNYSSLLAIEKE